MRGLAIGLVFAWLALTSPAAAQTYFTYRFVEKPYLPGSNMLSSYEGADAGRVVFSYTSTSDTILYVFLRRVDNGQEGWIATHAWFPKSRFDFKGRFDFDERGAATPVRADLSQLGLEYYDPKPRGSVATDTLQAGKYIVYRVLIRSEGLWRQDYEPLAIPLEIKAGQATYIGAFRAYAVYGKGALGRLRGWKIVVSDQSARDLPILKTKVTGVSDIGVDLLPADMAGRPDIGGQP